MRAHEPTAKGKTDAASRARLLIKSRLWWLDGFPGPDGWTAMPLDGSRPAEPLSLQREHLRRATVAIGKLVGEFPRALPRIVGDAERWAAAARQVVDLVKPWAHGGAPPPRDLFASELHGRAAREQAASIARERPALAPVVAALSWLLATRAAEAPRHLRWLARHADTVAGAFERCGPVVAVRLVHLGASLGELVAPLAALASHPKLGETPLDDPGRAGKAAAAIRPALNSVDGVPRAPIASTMPDEVAAWVAWLGGADRATARRFLHLLAACDLPALIDDWSGWWEKLATWVDRAWAIQRGRDRTATPESLKRLRRSIEEHAARRPVAVVPASLGECLRALAAAPAEVCLPPARAALARLTARPGLPAWFVIEWASHAGPALERLSWWIASFRDYLAATGPDEAALRPFIAGVSAEHSRHAYSLILDLQGRGRDHVKRVFTALTALHRRRPDTLARSTAQRIHQLCEIVEPFEPTRVADLGAALFDSEQAGGWLDEELLRAALTVSGGEPVPFAMLVRALRERVDAPGLPVDALAAALAPAFAGDLGSLRALYLDGDRHEVSACAEELAALAAVGGGTVSLPEPPPATWIDEFPPALHEALEKLARSCPDAEAIARRQIGAVWRSPAELEEELRAVEARLASEAAPESAASSANAASVEGESSVPATEAFARLAARRATLVRQIADRAPPRERDLRRLDEKLRRRASLERVRGLAAAASQRLGAATARHFGLAAPPGWLAEPRHLCLLPAVARLSARDRALAAELVRARSGPPPWDLREHPANRAFLRRLAARGIDAGPWLDGGAPVVRDTPVGRVHLAFEDDPIEVFHMGGHFGTCLSPGRFNFFSAVANAADINKRVLYARSDSGAVLGRRLFCLTGEGVMLVFNAYCHDARVGFDQMSAELARQLARRMHTRVDGHGHIPCLVAAHWYDDGSVDVTGQLAFLADDSPFRLRLADAPAAELPGLLAAELGPGGVDEQVAPMIAALPELSARPELALAFLPSVRDLGRLPDSTALHLAGLLESAGDSAAAADYFGEAIERSVCRRFRLNQWTDPAEIRLLARIAPGRALRALRRTHPEGARRLVDEDDATRLLAGATALELLHRPAQALALLRRAARATGPNGAVDAARRRLRELEVE